MIVNIRVQLEGLLEVGALASGLEYIPENQRAVLEYVIAELEKDLENSSSITEKLWIRQYILEAKLMLEELS